MNHPVTNHFRIRAMLLVMALAAASCGPRPVILDTDWWTDVDDAMAVRLALRADERDEIRLMGICVDAVRETSIPSRRKVDIVAIGYSNALASLLASDPGLVRRKVRHLWMMAGRYPEGKENNFTRTRRRPAPLCRAPARARMVCRPAGLAAAVGWGFSTARKYDNQERTRPVIN